MRGRTQDDLVPLAKAGVKGFKCFLMESGVDEFPCVTEKDVLKAMPKLVVRSAFPAFGETAPSLTRSLPRPGSLFYFPFPRRTRSPRPLNPHSSSLPPPPSQRLLDLPLLATPVPRNLRHRPHRTLCCPAPHPPHPHRPSLRRVRPSPHPRNARQGPPPLRRDVFPLPRPLGRADREGQHALQVLSPYPRGSQQGRPVGRAPAGGHRLCRFGPQPVYG